MDDLLFGIPIPEAILSDLTASPNTSRPSPPTTSPSPPPDHNARLREGRIYSRQFILTYQPVILFIVILVSIQRCSTGWLRRRRRRQRRQYKGDAGIWKDPRTPKNDEIQVASSSSSSSSSSTSAPSQTPRSLQAKEHDDDDESSPLLQEPSTSPLKQRSRASQATSYLRSLLLHQPGPLPIVARPMPSNGMSLFILALLGLNTLYLVHDSTGDLTLVADRAGLLFAANLPWLYVLGAKNQPVKALTGHSYENLNVLHRRLGEWMCFLALGHFAGFVAGWYRVLRPLGISFVHFVTIPAVAFGLGAWVCYEGLYFTSLAGFRRGWYEVFLGTHVVLQVVALGCLWMHFHFARGYIGVALLVYVVDRLVYRIGGKTRAFEADLTVLEDGETTLVSVNWSLPPTTTTSSSAMRQRIWVRNMRHGWQPSAHVFITLPHLSRGHRFQAHPMTIASAAPPSSSSSSDQRHAWLNLIVRAQGGFSRDLLHHARANPRTKVLLDGPYGSLHALEMLRDSDKAVVIAGGSGIAVAYPVVWALLHPEDSGGGVDDDAERQIARDDRREITLVWIVQDASHLSWLDAARLEELSAKGAKVVVPPPTRKSGRPDVRGLLRGAVAEDADGDGWSSSVGVVVSGPDGLNRSVRNFCAEMVREGLDVCVEVEKFGW